MKPKIATARALAAFIALRALKFVTIVFAIIVAILLACIWALAHYLSQWWWIFAIPLVIVVVIFVILRFVVLRIVGAIHRHPFTTTQREQLSKFTDKVTGLAEARATPLPLYALITLKDIVRHRDATTVRKLINDSKSLKGDFTELEKYFGDR